jgi:hypothetical protein
MAHWCVDAGSREGGGCLLGGTADVSLSAVQKKKKC